MTATFSHGNAHFYKEHYSPPLPRSDTDRDIEHAAGLASVFAGDPDYDIEGFAVVATHETVTYGFLTVDSPDVPEWGISRRV